MVVTMRINFHHSDLVRTIKLCQRRDYELSIKPLNLTVESSYVDLVVACDGLPEINIRLFNNGEWESSLKTNIIPGVDL